MTNYYIEKEGKIVLFDTEKTRLIDTLLFLPQYADLEIQETDRPIVDFEFADTPEYKAAELEKAKETKKAEITKEKEIAFKTGVVFNGAKFDCDDRAQTRLLFQFSNSKEGDTIIWLDYDYKPVEFNYESFMALCNEATAIVSGIEFKTGEYLAAVETAQTLEELEEIEINY